MATEDVLIKYRADITDLQSKIAIIEKEVAKIPKGADNAGKSFGGLGKLIAPLGGLIAAAFSVNAVINFGKESVEAFHQAELSAKKLETAVSVSGGLQEDFDNLIEQSKELQSFTIFNDEDIQNAQTAALQFGLTTDEVAKLIPVLADFASATQQSMDSALSAVLRGVEGQGKGLKLFGVNVDAAGSRVQNLASITDQLSAKFNDQARIVGETGSGAIARYNNQLDELKEKLGEDLEPAFLEAKRGVVIFTQGVVEGALAVHELVRSIAILLGDQGVAQERANKQNKETFDAAKKENEAMIVAFKDSFKDLTDGEITAELARYQELLQAAKKARSENINASAEEKSKMDEEIQLYASASLALRRVSAERLKQIEINKLSVENLKKLTSAQLEALQVQLRTKGDSASRDAVEEITKILEARKKAGTESAKLQAEQNAAREAAQKKADADLLQLTIDNIQNEFEKRREQAELDFNLFEKEKTEQVKQGLINQATRNALVIEAERKMRLAIDAIDKEEDTTTADDDLKKELDRIDKETTAEITKRQQAFNELGDFSIEAQNKLDDAIEQEELLGLKKRFEAVKKAGGDTTELASQIAAKEVAINKGKNDQIISQEQAAAEKRKQLFLEIQEAFNVFATAANAASEIILGGQIEAIESEQEASTERYDEEQEKLDEALENKQLTEDQHQKKSEEINARRVASEKKAAEEIKKVKTQQAVIDKTLAIFQATLNLAQAISVALSAAPPPFNATLAAISAALAGIQLAAIIATPIPKFKHGVDYVTLGANPPGEDTIPAYLDEGERVISREKNLKNWELYEAVDKDKLEQYVMKYYMTPVLKEQHKIYEKEQNKVFADNIAHSFQFNGLTYHDADYIRRRGTKLNNVDELTDQLSRKIARELIRAQKYDE